MLQFAHRAIRHRFACIIRMKTMLLCYASLLGWENIPRSALMFTLTTLTLETPSIFELMVESLGYVCN